jgi:hypothetical protein
MVTPRLPKPSKGREQVVTEGKLGRQAVNRGIEEKDDSTLARGADIDLTYEYRRVESNNLAALNSQWEGYCNKDAINQQNLAINYVERERDHLIQTHIPNSEPDSSDPRSLRRADLSALVKQISKISEEQKGDFYRVLEKYIGHMTKKPGRCNLLNGILEVSNSPILNPLTVVQREGKKIRICVEACKVNQYTIPDRERTPPLQELLQQFNGTCYMTSLDLSSACLLIELHEASRKYTAFLFDLTVYQYKRVPHEFRNSLPAFIWAPKLALGGGTTEYVDDILIHSKTFEEHLYHLDTVISKLTRAGFTLNATKCHFCREVKFLGHRIDKTGVSADPDRIEAIQNYPAPKNSKQLRQFLGICNFQSLHRWLC